MTVASARTSLANAALPKFRRVRCVSVAMCAQLHPEEYRIQPVEDVSPPWWNLGHTSWFFVRNVLATFGGRLKPEDKQYDYLLNSYYHSLGSRLPRDRRGAITRPTTDEIFRYRSSVDERVIELLETIDEERLDEMLQVLAIGIQHEQQHQELFYSEIKFIRFQNPARLREPYTSTRPPTAGAHPAPAVYREFDGGLFEFGNVEGGWGWDNELPVHKYYLEPFAIASRLVTNGEYLEFIADGGYRNPLLWLDNGWAELQRQGWEAPLYWEKIDGRWWNWTLHGMRLVASEEPVSHISFYEAAAFAEWKSQYDSDFIYRIPSEREWEHAARLSDNANEATGFVEAGYFHPETAHENSAFDQFDGCLWQWTSSYYEPYPGYKPFPGALAEYNGKFMDNQRVLRGGSCVTPRDHYRISYRNFWPAATRFQFSGLRLARNPRS